MPVNVKAVWLTSTQKVPRCAAASGRHPWLGPLVAERKFGGGKHWASIQYVALRFCRICNLIQILEVEA